ncbi:Lrp/AsnC family transcriptional regulator [Staphylococcus sp. ACRSN]|uniref:Lrp/AsnC family transcriptional regulator n=1 Tax=Staphylococcus sp. ACRSN TaxID=2918214 RepID=UPI001EF3AD66|nr:Lrp/AsnC family transcriptional regulator [Staphylococcus sp. ACRSN]MCG7339558.1 Lrp/AsnC family transcriptional regulator [Staphylococcus sp. ACRSN]
MDVTDENILNILMQDSKVSLNKISDKVNLSVPSVRERINKMKDSGIIKKYSIDINYGALGFDIDVIIDIIIKNNLYSDFKEFIKRQNNIEFCYRVSGESCFILKAHFEEMQKVEEFIDEVQYYGHTKTHFVFSRTV